MLQAADALETFRTDLEAGRVTLDAVVTRLADTGRDRDLATLLADRLSLDPDAVGRALMARWQETAAMMCRTVGLGTDGYAAVLRMRRRAGRTLDAAPSTLLAAYLQRPRASTAEIGERLRLLAPPAAAPAASADGG